MEYGNKGICVPLIPTHLIHPMQRGSRQVTPTAANPEECRLCGRQWVDTWWAGHAMDFPGTAMGRKVFTSGAVQVFLRHLWTQTPFRVYFPWRWHRQNSLKSRDLHLFLNSRKFQLILFDSTLLLTVMYGKGKIFIWLGKQYVICSPQNNPIVFFFIWKQLKISLLQCLFCGLDSTLRILLIRCCFQWISLVVAGKNQCRQEKMFILSWNWRTKWHKWKACDEWVLLKAFNSEQLLKYKNLHRPLQDVWIWIFSWSSSAVVRMYFGIFSFGIFLLTMCLTATKGRVVSTSS